MTATVEIRVQDMDEMGTFIDKTAALLIVLSHSKVSDEVLSAAEDAAAALETLRQVGQE